MNHRYPYDHPSLWKRCTSQTLFVLGNGFQVVNLQAVPVDGAALNWFSTRNDESGDDVIRDVTSNKCVNYSNSSGTRRTNFIDLRYVGPL